MSNRGYRAKAEPWSEDAPYAYDVQGAVPSGPHVENFLECLRTRREPNAPVEVGHLGVAAPHLANVAYHHKARARLDENATKVYV